MPKKQLRRCRAPETVHSQLMPAVSLLEFLDAVLFVGPWPIAVPLRFSGQVGLAGHASAVAPAPMRLPTPETAAVVCRRPEARLDTCRQPNISRRPRFHVPSAEAPFPNLNPASYPALILKAADGSLHPGTGAASQQCKAAHQPLAAPETFPAQNRCRPTPNSQSSPAATLLALARKTPPTWQSQMHVPAPIPQLDHITRCPARP